MKRMTGIKINPGGSDEVTFTDKPPAFIGADMGKEGADQTVLTVSREIQEVLIDIFDNTQALDKIYVQLDSASKTMMIVYEDLDDGWFNEMVQFARVE